ncbi:MAG: hypothetical protein WD851_19610 [Pirellulales bacterium]
MTRFRSYTMAELTAEFPRLPALPPLDHKLTWAELVALEPELAPLLAEAQAHHGTAGVKFCPNAVWYGYGDYEGYGLKMRMMQLVGYERRTQHPILSTPEAYRVVTDTIYDSLPDCGDCGCWNPW